jgi:hypothetical protein
MALLELNRSLNIEFCLEKTFLYVFLFLMGISPNYVLLVGACTLLYRKRFQITELIRRKGSYSQGEAARSDVGSVVRNGPLNRERSSPTDYSLNM